MIKEFTNITDTREPEIKQEVSIPVSELLTPPENDNMYGKVKPDDPDVQGLAISIMQEGILEPLVVSRDGYVISGNRRLVAAALAGLDKVPCRVDNITHHHPDFFRKVREHNRQRVKSYDVILREKLLDTDPEDAYQELIEFREQKAKVYVPALELGERKTRAKISKAKQPMVEAINSALKKDRKYWPLSARHIHYALLNNPPRIHASKPLSQYRNDLKSYNAVTELLARLRLDHTIPFECITDATRPYISWNVSAGPGEFIRDELDIFLRGYRRNLLQSQPNHIEIVIEKLAKETVAKVAARPYCIPVTVAKGFASVDPRHLMVERFKKSGKDKLVVLLISDFDPDGVMIAKSFCRSIRDDFHIDESRMHPVKVALTWEQVQEMQLPRGAKAKESKNRPAFVAQYGEYVWELEAIPSERLEQIIKEAIESVLDIDAFNREVALEREDAKKIMATRKTAIELLKGATGEK